MDFKNNKTSEIIELNLKDEIDYACFYQEVNLILLISKDYSIVIDVDSTKILYAEHNKIFAHIFTDFCKKENNKFYINVLRLSHIESFSLEATNNSEVISS